MHSGIFHGVENAEVIRDLIVERLRRFRETGLGDPDEERHLHSVATLEPEDGAVLQAAKDLLEEARRLRIQLTAK